MKGIVEMKKKFLSMVLSTVIAVTFIPTFAFAVENASAEEDFNIGLETESAENVYGNDSADMEEFTEENEMDGEDVAELIENLTGTSDVLDEVNEKKKAFVATQDNSAVYIPKDISEGISLSSEDNTELQILLPDTGNNEKGEMIDNTIVYGDGEKASATQAVQIIESDNDLGAYGVRSMIVIPDESSKNAYKYSFLLESGQKLIYAEDYPISTEEDKGYVYIIDETQTFTDLETGKTCPEILFEIEPAWAKDAEGNGVSTEYRISNNELIQEIELDEVSAFPVVADPQVGGEYYRKQNVSYSTSWSSYKRVSDNLKGPGSIHCQYSKSFSGSVSGTIKGITTIGVGASYTSTKGYTLKVGKCTRYMGYRVKYKIEKGTRVVYNSTTGRVKSKNSYTVKKPIHGEYALRTP